MSVLCSMVGASFTVAAVAEVLRSKKGIQAFGNAQIDTAQSKFGGASALFDGNGDYLNSATGFSFAGDFTVEFFVRFASIGANSRGLATDRPPTSGGYTTSNWYIEKNTNNGLFAGISGFGDIITSNSLVTTNTWYHIAFVRSGTTVSLYLDGISRGTPLTCGTSVGDGDISFGAIVGLYLDGHMDEIRVSNTSRYTAGFTPSTTAFVNDANTVLLMHMDGTDAATFFEDDNGTGRSQIGIQAVNNAQVDTAQSKFGGSSALFDGTTDYLFVTSNSTLAHGAGNFTIEMWVRFTSQPTAGNYRVFYDVRPASTNGAYPVLTQKGTSIVYYANSADRITSSALTTNTWYHLAVSRSGTDTKMFIDGTQAGSTYTDSTTYLNSNIFIGGDSFSNTSLYAGYLDEVRISNSARYTTTFTPSTTPFVNDSNTLLLLHMDGTDASTVFRDDNGTGRSQRSIIATGGAQVDTAQSKFGGASALFDGTLDWLTCAMVGTGYTATDLTIECWVRPAAIQTKAIMTSRTQDNTLATGEFQLLFLDSGFGTKWQFALGSNQIDMRSTTTYAANTWYHLAVTRNISTNGWTFYVNGTSEATATNATNFANNNISIGAYLTGTLSMNGHVDEVRISNTRRYTANFTPSTTAFQNDSNTLLLLHMDGTDASTVFTDDNGVTPTHSYT
jgi:hypothetical protein